MKQKLEKYLRTRAVRGPWQLEGVDRQCYQAAVVIPALAESAALPETLVCLAANPLDYLEKTLIVIVVNNCENSPESQRQDNQRTLNWLQSRPCPELNLAWIDAASPGADFPAKEGVGLARKIGCDLALEVLDDLENALLISLDADTRVDENYLNAVFSHFAESHQGGAVIPFKHQPGKTLKQERAIRDYELYLRSYLYGLQLAGSPYAYHAIGSTLACRAETYIAVGGMNRRSAAEDFYFLQQVAKVSGVTMLHGTLVRPSPRFSERVPFGTGRAVQAQVEEGKQLYRFVSVAAFQLLRDWLTLVQDHLDDSAEIILSEAKRISPPLSDFLNELNFSVVWNRIHRNHSSRQQRLRAFHQWFDALRTRQLLMRVPSSESESQARATELLHWGGVNDVQDPLRFLEQQQGVCAENHADQKTSL
ncbi:MAG: hypothetical protein JXQ81_03340 [Desulfuromonadales bacterium]|nr:hypothetical protein [Desulfuromonadales bacterium]MBN2791522.1 hypothetical protein [Desulfuromonadales bacterium]